MGALTGVLSESWQLYRRHAAHFLLISFAVYLVIAVVSAILGAFLGAFGTFLGDVLDVVGMFLVQAALVKAVEDVRDGRADLNVRETVSAALPAVGAVAVASILASIAIWIGFALIIVPGLVLATFLSLIVPCIVLGQSSALGSFARSWRTVTGHGWSVFCTFVLTFLLMIIAYIVLATILSFLPHTVAIFLAEVISGMLVAPFIATVVTLVYYRLTTGRGGSPFPPPATEPGWPRDPS
jgi:hypothetical protein